MSDLILGILFTLVYVSCVSVALFVFVYALLSLGGVKDYRHGR